MNVFTQLVQSIQNNDVYSIITGSNETEMALIDSYANPQTVAQRFDALQLRLIDKKRVSITATYILHNSITDEFIFQINRLYKNDTQWVILPQSEDLVRWAKMPDGSYALEYPVGNLAGQILSNILPTLRKKPE